MAYIVLNDQIWSIKIRFYSQNKNVFYNTTGLDVLDNIKIKSSFP